jgi:hypothetical protein
MSDYEINMTAAPVTEQTVYRLDGITYLPHYTITGVFVGPGYPRHNREQLTPEELLSAGARKGKAHLWITGARVRPPIDIPVFAR